MPLTPSGVVVGLLYLALVGVDTRGFSHALGVSLYGVGAVRRNLARSLP